MTQTIQQLTHAVRGAQLIRKKRLLEKLQFSKSSLHAKMTEGSLYYDSTFPRPIYFPHSRIPLWSEEEIDAWINQYASQRKLPIACDSASRGVASSEAA